MSISHQDNFYTNLSSNISAGATTSPVNSIPSVDAPFYVALDAGNLNGKFEIVLVTSKTSTNLNHAATAYAHTTAEEIVLVTPATEMNSLSKYMEDGWVTADGTWSATDANTISIAGVDLTGILQKGDKIKVTNDSAVKYYYISSVPAFSTNTTFDVSGEVDLVAGAITLPYFSKIDNPQGFKKGEIYYTASSASAGQTINDNTITKIQFGAEIFDPNNNFDSVTNYRYTVPISGYYRILASIVVYDANNAIAQARLYIYKNGASHNQRSVFSSLAANATILSIDNNIKVFLNKGDYIEFFAFADTTDSGQFAITDSPRFLIEFVGV